VTAIECYFHADEMSPSEVLEQQLIGKFEVQSELRGLCDAARLWRYSVSQRERDRADSRIEPGRRVFGLPSHRQLSGPPCG